MGDLITELGLRPGSSAVIISCDELGFCHAANVAIFDAMRRRPTTSASLMVPAPWSRAAIAEYRGEDVGVHLTLNSELELYRWGPITASPSLLDGDGAFPRTVDDIWAHADLDEVRREWRAQIERAVLWGFNVNHLDAHLAGVELKPEFFDVYLDLADEFHLPVRLPGLEEERRIGFPFRALADERGIVAPDRVVSLLSLGTTAEAILEALARLAPGVTEIHAHPAIDMPELRAATPDFATRITEAELLMELEEVIGSAIGDGLSVIGYRVLRDLMTDGRLGAP